MSDDALEGTPAWEPVSEQAKLSSALLKTTSFLARARQSPTVLRLLCEGLAGASPRIRLAWVMTEDEGSAAVQAKYMAGTARDFLKLMLSRKEFDLSRCPSFRALQRQEPQLGPIPADDTYAPIKARAEAHGIREILSLPFAFGTAGQKAVISLAAEEDGYFRKVGLETFNAFLNLAQTLLERIGAQDAHAAMRDPLTGLLNRAAIQAHAEEELIRCRQQDASLCLLLFNIDRFKLINHSFGPRQGDHILQRVCHSAQAALREGDLLGRWSGEEILCVLPRTDLESACQVAEALRDAVARTGFAFGAEQFRVSVSAGLSAYPQDGADLAALLSSADAALYEAKASGRNRVAKAQTLRQQIFPVGSTLDAALREERVLVAYQPIVDLSTGQAVAEEALARVCDRQGRVWEATDFIGPATKLQLVHRIDYTVVTHALGRCLEQTRKGSRLAHFFNLSGDLMRHPDLVHELLEQAKAGCRSCGDLLGEEKPLVIEITERELFGDMDNTRRLLDPFLDFGFRLALDDFGSGYSSLQYLAELPFTYLKIEGSLVRRLREPKVRAIVQGIQNTADDLGLITLAEFIEDEETAEQVRKIGVHWGQGYFFGHPLLEAPRESPVDA